VLYIGILRTRQFEILKSNDGKVEKMNPEERSSQSTSLLMSRGKAEEQIGAQIQEAARIRDINIDGWDTLRNGRDEEAAWADYTTELLARIFSDPSEGDKFRKHREALQDNSTTDFHNQGRYLRDRLNRSIAYLESVIKRMPLIPETDVVAEAETTDLTTSPPEPKNIKHALELYEKARALHRHAQPLDERLARMIIESANDAVQEFGSTNQEKKVELRRIAEEAGKVLPPASFEDMRKRAEGEILQRAYPRTHVWRNVFIGIVVVIVLIYFVSPIFSLLWPRRLDSSNSVRPERSAVGAQEEKKSVVSSPLPTASIEPELASISLKVIADVSEKNLDSVLQSLRTSKQLRVLAPLERGKSIENTPSGTYFFISPIYLSHSREKQQDVLKSDAVTGLRDEFGDDLFEIHKVSDNQVEVVAFVSGDAAQSISKLDGKATKEVVLSSVPWADNKTLIIIPYERILTAKYRRVDTPERRMAPIMDAAVR
jgi:hypothetical protein